MLSQIPYHYHLAMLQGVTDDHKRSKVQWELKERLMESEIGMLKRELTRVNREHVARLARLLLRRLDKVEEGFREATQIQERLRYSDRHSSCIIKALREEIRRKGEETVRLRVELEKSTIPQSGTTLNEGEKRPEETERLVEMLKERLEKSEEEREALEKTISTSSLSCKTLTDILMKEQVEKKEAVEEGKWLKAEVVALRACIGEKDAEIKLLDTKLSERENTTKELESEVCVLKGVIAGDHQKSPVSSGRSMVCRSPIAVGNSPATTPDLGAVTESVDVSTGSPVTVSPKSTTTVSHESTVSPASPIKDTVCSSEGGIQKSTFSVDNGQLLRSSPDSTTTTIINEQSAITSSPANLYNSPHAIVNLLSPKYTLPRTSSSNRAPQTSSPSLGEAPHTLSPNTTPQSGAGFSPKPITLAPIPLTSPTRVTSSPSSSSRETTIRPANIDSSTNSREPANSTTNGPADTPSSSKSPSTAEPAAKRIFRAAARRSISSSPNVTPKSTPPPPLRMPVVEEEGEGISPLLHYLEVIVGTRHFSHLELREFPQVLTKFVPLCSCKDHVKPVLVGGL
eukprot:sb/3463456/